jgi:hypothetical protein
MPKHLYKRKTDSSRFKLDVTLGGVDNLRLVTKESVGSVNGVAGLNELGLLNEINLPPTYKSGNNNITGPDSVLQDSISSYTISDYDDFTEYVLKTVGNKGSIFRNKSIITYTAPSLVGSYGFVINDKRITVQVTPSLIKRPSIDFPIDNSINQPIDINFSSSNFISSILSDTHQSSDWVLATDIEFTNIVRQSINSSLNLTTWSVNNLDYDTTYYYRCRYKNNTGLYSSWSLTKNFDTRISSLPSVEEAKLVPSVKDSDVGFGSSIKFSSDGSRVAIGVPRTTVSGFTSAGSVYVYRRSGKTWVQEARLVANDPDNNRRYGRNLSISGDGTRLFVGSSDNVGVFNKTINDDSCYIYVRSGTTWTLEEKLISPEDVYTLFGYSVDTNNDGSLLVIGTPYKTLSAIIRTGIGYIYERVGTTWSLKQTIEPPEIEQESIFGFSVSMSDNGNTIAISSPNKNVDNVVDVGVTYVYIKSGANWVLQDTLNVLDKQPSVYIGHKISLSSDGNRVVVSGELVYSGSIQVGAAYVFVRSGGVWTQEAKLDYSDKKFNTLFGSHVSINNSGNKIVIGARLGQSSRNNAPLITTGKVYIYSRTGSDWIEEGSLIGSDTLNGDQFGLAVDISSDGLRIGATSLLNDSSGVDALGSGYIFN